MQLLGAGRVTRRSFFHRSGLTIAATAASACAPGTANIAPAPPASDAASIPGWDDLVAAARQEGKLALQTRQALSSRTSGRKMTPRMGSNMPSGCTEKPVIVGIWATSHS